MTDPDLFKELGIKRHRAVLEMDGEALYYVKLVEDAEGGDLVFTPDLMAAIRRGDLIPRSRIEAEIKVAEEAIKKFQEMHDFDTTAPQHLWESQIWVCKRLLKGEPKP